MKSLKCHVPFINRRVQPLPSVVINVRGGDDGDNDDHSDHYLNCNRNKKLSSLILFEKNILNNLTDSRGCNLDNNFHVLHRSQCNHREHHL